MMTIWWPARAGDVKEQHEQMPHKIDQIEGRQQHILHRFSCPTGSSSLKVEVHSTFPLCLHTCLIIIDIDWYSIMLQHVGFSISKKGLNHVEATKVTSPFIHVLFDSDPSNMVASLESTDSKLCRNCRFETLDMPEKDLQQWDPLNILWIEKILYQLWTIRYLWNTVNNWTVMGKPIYQLVQDFFHPQYLNVLCSNWNAF